MIIYKKTLVENSSGTQLKLVYTDLPNKYICKNYKHIRFFILFYLKNRHNILFYI